MSKHSRQTDFRLVKIREGAFTLRTRKQTGDGYQGNTPGQKKKKTMYNSLSAGKALEWLELSKQEKKDVKMKLEPDP